MEITGLKYLLAVAEAGSFTAAARGLNLQASTLSRHIAGIEKELGLTVFERDHSGVRLTRLGRADLCATGPGRHRSHIQEWSALRKEHVLVQD